MTAPTIETLTAAVASKLESIRVENGYRSDVKRVFRVRLLPDQVTNLGLPVLVLVTPPNAHRFTPEDGKVYQGTLRLVVGGIVGQGTGDLRDSARATLLNHLMQDVMRALLEDPAFGFSPIVDSVLEDVDDEIDTDRALAYFTLQFHLTYHFEKGTL